MARVARPSGAVGAYVWDYPGEMPLVKFFWEAAIALDADAAALDPRPYFHACQPGPLTDLYRVAGLSDIVGVAQRYAAALDDDRKAALRERPRVMLPTGADGTISLIGRAWAVRATKGAG